MLLKVTVSGDYRTSGKAGSDIVDFDNVVITMPDCIDDHIMFNVQNRMLQIAILKDKRYTQHYEMFRSVYVDKVERIEGKSAIIGKNIKELTWEELQELAVYKHLRDIPGYRATDLRYAREKAYIEYSKHFLGKKIDPDAKGYNFANLPDLVVDGTDKVATAPTQKSNEESLKEEQESRATNEEKTFTMKELRKLAKDKGIKLPPNVTYNEAVKLVIG